MAHLRTVSAMSSISISDVKRVFRVLKYRTIEIIIPRGKVKQCLAFPLVITHAQHVRLINLTCTTTNIKRSNFIKTLSKILQCSEGEAYSLYQNHSQLSELQIHELQSRVEELQKYGIENFTIKENIWILFVNTHQISSKLELLKKWKFTNLNNAVDLVQLPFTKLNKYTFQVEKELSRLDDKNRITYYSSFIKCDEKEACKLFLKHPFMMTLNLEAFKAILTLSKGVGVLKADMLRDPWLFTYSPKFIANRIKFLDDIEAKQKCKVIKPWMLRCTQTTINRYFELRDENMAALGSYTNLKDLLGNELDLVDAEVEEMFTKHPPLAKISYSKAKDMIDFLKSEGFGSKMIYQVPRVLCHKQATLMGRILELKKANPRMMSLQNLCRNKKDYLSFLKKVQSSHP